MLGLPGAGERPVWGRGRDTGDGARRALVGRLRSLLAPGLVLAAGGVAAAVVLWLDPTDDDGILLFVCPFRLLLGVNCPGCGVTRMIYSLLHFDLASAARYNALGLVALPLFAWLYAIWSRQCWRGGNLRSPARLRGTSWLVGVVLLVWTVLRNLPFEPFRSLSA